MNRRDEEFDRFVRAHADSLLRSAFLLTGDLQEAEDLVQETLAGVARRWRRVASMASPTGYARRVLVNRIIDGSTRRRRRRDELGRSGAPDLYPTGRPDGALQAVDGRLDLLQALQVLPARQRAVLVLRYWEDLSEGDTADVLGCSTGTVKSTASRGLARLRNVLATTPTPTGEIS